MKPAILLIDGNPVDVALFQRACRHVGCEGRLVVAPDARTAVAWLGYGRDYGVIVAFDEPGRDDLSRIGAALESRFGRDSPPLIALHDPAHGKTTILPISHPVAARLPRPTDSRSYDELVCTLRDFWMHRPGRKLARWAVRREVTPPQQRYASSRS
ncbi:hypothetical protein [Erythrobacter litoralis]|uniref:Uncharacterized protein n=1 Tax=Erythrobacter litoralis (strain HTCC2594) TaxID=314225 RepID=Q2N8D0_ERYLH|nr:hypothetical protein [Erythrobacter litoralis]ABC64061.1 hypothetical protein ELI_09845 [Erythrobacter litoralis HTCC2594]